MKPWVLFGPDAGEVAGQLNNAELVRIVETRLGPYHPDGNDSQVCVEFIVGFYGEIAEAICLRTFIGGYECRIVRELKTFEDYEIQGPYYDGPRTPGCKA